MQSNRRQAWLLALGAAAAFSALAQSAAAQTYYRWVDEYGRTQISDQPPGATTTGQASPPGAARQAAAAEAAAATATRGQRLDASRAAAAWAASARRFAARPAKPQERTPEARR